MGAQTFEESGKGKTVSEAFNDARERSLYDNGHRGYTGTLAEKTGYVVIPVPADWKDTPLAYARHLIDEGDPRIDNKWGPAGAIELETGAWLFFGWASC